MTVEEAILTAIKYENKVRDVYYTAAKKVKNASTARVLSTLAGEEQHHVDYLEAKLNQWRQTGQLSSDRLGTVIPSKEQIKEGVSRLKAHMDVVDEKNEIAILEQALEVEKETSDFYGKMAKEMQSEARTMFARFFEIEHGHLAIVSAELDSVKNMGFWFDFREFNLEIES